MSSPSAPLSPSPANSRPLADRDCSRTDGAKNQPPRNPKRSQSQRKLGRAGTYSNARLPRTSSAANGLPRGRSFQGNKAQTLTAQANVEGYLARKAAKMYAEKRKAAAALPSPSAPQRERLPKKDIEVINITVDDSGIKFAAKGMGSRNNSRTRITRSNSRRGEDKENDKVQSEVDGFFSRTIAVEGEKSWDGSMPKRQNSRSLIETTRQKEARDVVGNNLDPSPQADVKPSPSPRRQRSRRRAPKKKEDVEVKVQSGELSPTTSSVSETDAASPDDTSTHPTVQGEKVQEACTVSTVVKNDAESETSEVSKSSASSSDSKAPLNGKWCDECAGVGLHIAALLTELESHRPVPETGAETSPSGSNGKKTGWKSMLTGSVTEKKSSTEKARLQQEINVLRATVDFLYNKIERLEKSKQ